MKYIRYDQGSGYEINSQAMTAARSDGSHPDEITPFQCALLESLLAIATQLDMIERELYSRRD